MRLFCTALALRVAHLVVAPPINPDYSSKFEEEDAPDGRVTRTVRKGRVLAQTARSGEPLGDWSSAVVYLLADVLHVLPSFTFSRVLQGCRVETLATISRHDATSSSLACRSHGRGKLSSPFRHRRRAPGRRSSRAR
eukprot:scaffold63303_cov52-Phaeocystis_antarctica.AAC.2